MREPKPGEVLLDDPSEMWLRPTFPDALVDRDTIGRQAFRLQKNDNGELSGARGSLRTPAEAEEDRLERRRAEGRSLTSAGTWGITVEQLGSIDLQCFDDTADPVKLKGPYPPPYAHAIVDLTHLDENAQKNKQFEMAEKANENGLLTARPVEAKIESEPSPRA